jgi:hypothetical protein
MDGRSRGNDKFASNHRQNADLLPHCLEGGVAVAMMHARAVLFAPTRSSPRETYYCEYGAVCTP